MVSDLRVYRTAQVLVTQYGADAPTHASMRHDEVLERVDIEGTAVWKRVLAAIDVLLGTGRPDGQALH